MSPRIRRLALTGHLTFSVGWLGAALAYLAIAFRALTVDDLAFARGAYPVLALVGWYVIVPLSLGALASGVVQALGTPWGLFRHYWVLAKLAFTFVGTAVLLLHMPVVSRVGTLVEVSSTSRVDLGVYPLQLVIHATGGAALLLVVIAISVFKPWGKSALGRQRVATAGGE